jgi:hypothetical protein
MIFWVGLGFKQFWRKKEFQIAMIAAFNALKIWSCIGALYSGRVSACKEGTRMAIQTDARQYKGGLNINSESYDIL